MEPLSLFRFRLTSKNHYLTTDITYNSSNGPSIHTLCCDGLLYTLKHKGQGSIGAKLHSRWTMTRKSVSFLQTWQIRRSDWPSSRSYSASSWLISWGISSSILSVFFTDNCYKLLKSLHLIGWEQICQWKTLTKRLMKCPSGHRWPGMDLAPMDPFRVKFDPSVFRE